MIRILFLILALLPGVALAEPIRVQSGEHDGFTRLVLDYGKPVDWQVGRSADGYELRVNTSASYDFTQVFDLIGKGRLAAIWADPVSGALRIGIACPCHAIPFEFRPGIVVVDLKDGPPPPESSFELALDGTATPDLSARPLPRPRPRPENMAQYNWLEVALTSPSDTQTAVPLPDVEPSLQPLRDALLRQLSRGATQGVVDMAHPKGISGQAGAEGNPSVQIRMGELPGLEATTPDQEHALSSAGLQCPPESALDIAGWGDDRPISEQLGDSVQGLIGEFDKPDPEAVGRAVKFHLYIGFGAEARQLLQAFPAELPDSDLWRSLSYILDGDEYDSGSFRNMSACNSAAALWAALSEKTLSPDLNTQAVLLSFSGLPAHLRHLLGPDLARRFLEADDNESARAIRDAILRAPGSDDASVELLQADMHMQSGHPEDAETDLKTILADPGPNATDALIGYVEARYAQALPMEADIVPALEAIVQEQSGTVSQPKAVRALGLAQASSGDFPAAFATADALPEIRQDIWNILAGVGVDDAILDHAILTTDAQYPVIDPATAEALAQRLLDLGFSVEAAAWLDTIAAPNPLLSAKVALAKGEPRAALMWLSGATDAESVQIRAFALQELGDYTSAADVFAKSGAGDLAVKASILAKDWSAYPEAKPEPWATAAQYIAPAASGDEMGPLARGQDIVETSTATRLAVSDLLAALPNP